MIFFRKKKKLFSTKKFQSLFILTLHLNQNGNLPLQPQKLPKTHQSHIFLFLFLSFKFNNSIKIFLSKFNNNYFPLISIPFSQQNTI